MSLIGERGRGRDWRSPRGGGLHAPRSRGQPRPNPPRRARRERQHSPRRDTRACVKGPANVHRRRPLRGPLGEVPVPLRPPRPWERPRCPRALLPRPWKRSRCPRALPLGEVPEPPRPQSVPWGRSRCPRALRGPLGEVPEPPRPTSVPWGPRALRGRIGEVPEPPRHPWSPGRGPGVPAPSLRRPGRGPGAPVAPNRPTGAVHPQPSPLPRPPREPGRA